MKKFYRRKKHSLRKLGVALLSIAQTLYITHSIMSYYNMTLNSLDPNLYVSYAIFLGIIVLSYFTYEFYNAIIEFIAQEIKIKREEEYEDEVYRTLHGEETGFLNETKKETKIIKLKKINNSITIDTD